ncbi:hypothetical protein [Arhodomonas sp. AD133]|uniref:hypothetical protein n=1 Tax=Arhodomonas sp. AD133 TaxID=3415009 RepID=UPI003EB6F521
MNTRTIRVMGFIVVGYLLLCAPVAFWPQYLDTPLGFIAAFPFVSVYLFHAIGIPGLLENSGACGWSWCAPTLFGWGFIAAFWLVVLWLVAKAIVSMTSRRRRSSGTPD